MEQNHLFSSADNHKEDSNIYRPLAERLRPKSLSDVVGQNHLIGPNGRLSKMLAQKHLPSIILWGPPGCGKTTIARLLAKDAALPFKSISAIYSGVAELKKIFAPLEQQRQMGAFKPLVLFVDEIHRFNKAQQDAFLPHVESGLIILIGATTENPSFSLNSAILSRCSVETLQRLSHEALENILETGLNALEADITLQPETKTQLLHMADGDARYLLNILERLASNIHDRRDIDTNTLNALVSARSPVYDSNEEAHYNLISALHKSVRGSDPDAALYWFSRMIDGGEDLQFLARRILRMASEDIGLAAPQALSICLNAWESYERLGSPEGELALAQAVIYLATAPKSNAVYTAYKDSMKDARAHGSLMPPTHILNAPTNLMKNLGYGQNYIYDHDTEHGISGQNYFPDAMQRQEYYKPKEIGFEKSIKERLDYSSRIRSEYRDKGGEKQ